MVLLQVAARPNGDFEIEGAPSLDVLNDTLLIRQAGTLEEIFFQNLPETTYLMLLEAMNRRISDIRMRAVMQRMTEAAGPGGVAAVLHHADGTKEATILQDGEEPEDDYEAVEGELYSAGEMGIRREDLTDEDFEEGERQGIAVAISMAKRVSAKAEQGVLIWFFSNIGGAMHLVEKGKLIPGGEAHGLYQAALGVLRDRLAAGWTMEEIRAQLLDAKDLSLKTVSLQDVIPPLPAEWDARNLMQAGTPYTHPALCLCTPPQVRYDPDTEQMLVVDAGCLTRRETFTMKDLIAYYTRVLEPTQSSRIRLQTALNWFLQNGATLDELLFAIDFWKHNDRDESRGAVPWRLRDYLGEASLEREWRLKGAQAIVN